MARTYYEKLEDPLWQRKRLEIMQRDGFKCLRCGSTRNTLTVHHVYYDRRDPWDYPDHAYQTLCKKGCHEHVQNLQIQVFECVAKLGVPQLEVLAERLKAIVDGCDTGAAMDRVLDLIPGKHDEAWRDRVFQQKKADAIAQLEAIERRGGA